MVDLDLTSARSERGAELRRLHDRRHRETRGAFVVEGPAGVEAALDRGVVELYVTAQAQERFADLVGSAER
ncbi:MAG: RNA methyltransferase, partial [Actinomycetota bacterium]